MAPSTEEAIHIFLVRRVPSVPRHPPSHLLRPPLLLPTVLWPTHLNSIPRRCMNLSVPLSETLSVRLHLFIPATILGTPLATPATTEPSLVRLLEDSSAPAPSLLHWLSNGTHLEQRSTICLPRLQNPLPVADIAAPIALVTSPPRSTYKLLS